MAERSEGTTNRDHHPEPGRVLIWLLVFSIAIFVIFVEEGWIGRLLFESVSRFAPRTERTVKGIILRPANGKIVRSVALDHAQIGAIASVQYMPNRM